MRARFKIPDVGQVPDLPHSGKSGTCPAIIVVCKIDKKFLLRRCCWIWTLLNPIWR